MRSGQPPSVRRIVLLSALILFVEMLLVRWVGTEVRVFAYLQNSVLVATFLGLGLGCRSARSRIVLLPAVVALLVIGLFVRDPLGLGIGELVTQGLAAFADSQLWHTYLHAGPAEDWRYLRLVLIAYALGVTLVLLWACARVFHPLGQWLGRWMDGHPRPIAAYTANIAGSILGIALFDAATLLRTAPWVWLLVSALGLLVLAFAAEDRRGARLAAAAGALALPLLGWSPSPSSTVWSPYQKLTLAPLEVPSASDGRRVRCGTVIRVNNVGYQLLLDLDPARMAAAPEKYPSAEIRTSHYVLPYELVGTRERVLVVGAGAGNDVAAALRAGAREVDAVEIDPAILDLGRAYHQNAPYAAPAVKVTVDDARAFFRRARGPYDLVWFGLLDSHTTPSAYTNVRLDHFVYTRESFAEVRRLLAPSGVLVLFFDPQTPWIADRLFGLVRDTFGSDPLALRVKSSTPCLGWGGLLLVGGARDVVAAVRARAEADAGVRPSLLPADAWPGQTSVTTDDWPYLYLPGPGIPKYHLLVGLACLAIGVRLRRRMFAPGQDLNAVMLLLGAGFMLLEVSGVSRAALLFGTTWTVNAYVVGAILAMVLFANLVASRVAVDAAGWPFAGLVVTLLAVGLVPTAALAALPTPARIILGGGFLALPVFFSGLVFVTVWATDARKDLALGSNLLGSLLGGLASMLSMAIGFRALTFLTLAVYLGARLLIRRAP